MYRQDDHSASGRFIWARDASVCLQYFAEARNFAAWTCSEEAAAQRFAAAEVGGYCVMVQGHESACLKVSI